MSDTIQWDQRPESVFPLGFEEYTRAVEEALRQLVESYRPRIEAWMKANAPWTDRTGNARQGLHTEVEALTNGIALYLMHSMDYGVFLEWANQGTFAILTPALDVFGPQIWEDVKALFAA